MLVDFRHLLRNLRRSPASAIAAILTLSLTIGAGASIFAVVDAVLLTPPPFTNPDALALVRESPLGDSGASRAVTYATFDAWRERAASLAELEAFDGTNLTLTGIGAAERVTATNVTPGFLTLLGVAPALGRLFDREDAGQPVAIVSHTFWRGTLAGDPGVIGREIVVGGRRHAIVGVLPAPFVFALSTSDVWRPFPVTPAQAVQSGYRVSAVARLGIGASAESLERALDDVSRRSSPSARTIVTPIATAIAGDARRTLGLLAGAAALAVLIAFTNLAGLLIVRSIDRRRELAVRTALGARRSDIARQLVLEAQTLVVAGIAGGLLLALWMTPAAGRLALEQFGGIARSDIGLSWRMIGAVSIVASACAWLCASMPALMAARRSVVDTLRRGATSPPRDVNLRRMLVTGEVALAFVLLVSVTLLGRSLLRVLDVNPGFEPRGVVKLQVSLPDSSYPTMERIVSFYATLESALERRLGRNAFAIVDEIPLTGDGGRGLVSRPASDRGQEAVLREASSAYFHVMRIPLLAGRPFNAGDNSGAPRRAVVSRSAAERLFPSEQPVGRLIQVRAIAQPIEIVGVVGDVKHRALDEAVSPTIYLSAWQSPSRSRNLVVRSELPESDIVTAVREEVRRLDGNLPVYRIQSMRDVVAASPGVPARRVLTATFTGFALLAVVLGAIGLFGVVAHDVASRRAELGLRIALGAGPVRILAGTLAQGAVMLGIGLAAGAVLSIWAARAFGALLYAPDRWDVAGAAGAAALLAAVDGGAVLPAALRAAHTDPLVVLRSE